MKIESSYLRSAPFVVALIHSILVIFIFVNMFISQKGYGGWYFLYLLDFPVSTVFQLFVKSLKNVVPTSIMHEFPSSKIPLLLIIQFSLYFIFGSVWYYLVAIALQKLWNFIRS